MEVAVHDSTPQSEDFLREVIDGLNQDPKILPCKYLYDERGSELFESICDLEEYYQTRTELAIMEAYAGEMADIAGPRCLLIELGSGSSLKTRVLLDHLEDPAGYVPIEISHTMLEQTARELAQEYPDLTITPICADYTAAVDLPAQVRDLKNRLVYFPGSTIGNFHPDAAIAFLSRMASLAGPTGGVLIGVDMKKDREILVRAYDDARGITAAFNLNLLERINRELGGTFSLETFRHEARYNAEAGRIEMHLVSLCDQEVSIGKGHTVEFAAGESVRTECSYKYHPQEFAALAGRAGLEQAKVWMDSQRLFSVQLLRVAD